MTYEPKLNEETTARMKAAISNKLKKGTTLTDEEKAAFLEVNNEIFRLKYPIDSDCKDIPPWERAPNQITRDITNTRYYFPDDTGYVRRFEDESRNWLAWNDLDQKWYAWTGKYWTSEHAYHNAVKTTEYITESLFYETPAFSKFGITTEEGKGKVPLIKQDQKFASLCNVAPKNRARAESVKIARSYLVQKFNTSKAIPFDNCMYDPDTGNIAPHKPEDYNTTLCPTALNLNAPPFPEGEQFFNDISDNRPEWTKALFRALGECLRYGNKDQWFLVFYGTGGNGKGTLTEWLQSTLGGLVAVCGSIEIDVRNNPRRQTDICNAFIRGCRILLFPEAGGVHYDDEIMKGITGESHVSLTRIQSGQASYEISGTPILITNTLPTSSSGGEAMKRRQIGFPFSHRIERENGSYIDKLTTKEGNEWLLCQIVSAAEEARRTGAPKLKYCLPACVSVFTDLLINESDQIHQFLNECCTVTRNQADRTSRRDLYTAFTAYCYSDEGTDPTPTKDWMKAKDFSNRLQGHNIQLMNGKQKTTSGVIVNHVFQGILLNEAGLELLNRADRR